MFDDLENKEIKLKNLKVRYMCVGNEICPTTGKPHLQGYVHFGEKKTLKAVKVEVDAQAHWEPAQNPIAAIEYCKKDGMYWETGFPPVKGARNDLTEIAEQVRSGATMEEISETNPAMMVRYSRGLTALRMNLMKHRTEKPHVMWIWGPTGVGKTKMGVDLSSSFYMKDGTIWWDGYEQQKTIIIDDFDGKWNFRDLLRLLDWYPYQGQCKGGYVKINSSTIVITCEHPPSRFWNGSELAQVMRRIDEEIHLRCPDAQVPGGCG